MDSRRYTQSSFSETKDSTVTSAKGTANTNLVETVVRNTFSSLDDFKTIYQIEETTLDLNVLRTHGYSLNVTQKISTLIILNEFPKKMSVLIEDGDFLKEWILLNGEQLTIVTPKDSFVDRVLTRVVRYNHVDEIERLTGDLIREIKNQLCSLLYRRHE